MEHNATSDQRDYKKQYDDCVWDVLSILGTYKEKIRENDIMWIGRTKAILVANKAILNMIYADACGFYTGKKREAEKKRDSRYLELRKTITQGDAEKQAKVDTYDDFMELDELKLKKDKAWKLLEDVRDTIIEMAVLLKSLKEEEKFG